MRVILLTAMLLMLAAPAMAQMAEAPVDAGVFDAGPAEPGTDPGFSLDPDEPIDALGKVVESARTGNWRLVAAGALVLVMFALRRARDHVKWFAGDRGGAVLVGLLGLAGAFSAALATAAPIGWDLALGALGVTFTAVGGWTWCKRLLGK